ncbi:MAG TPA: hypothetical protein DCM12_04525 [Gammaproteobacteria bacterium]|nr:hypothetical protein [Gammaproteobacteria bacterium]|tara:strand:- start:41414 stop:45076 length:3663 start_codon:yes stop_codon:yes gene_type:complete
MPVSAPEKYKRPFEGKNPLLTLVDLLQYRVRCQSEETAYVFLNESGEVEESLTYQGLHERALAIAYHLSERKMQGQRALLLYGPGLDFHAAFLGCQYAKVVAVPMNPPRMNRNIKRLSAVIGDADVRSILTTSKILHSIQIAGEKQPELMAVDCLVTDSIQDDLPSWSVQPVKAGSLAFLQYTSGSTGTPKGVKITHANMMHNARLVHLAGQHCDSDKYVSWLPTFHDMGFMVGLLQPLYAGIPAILMSPASFLKSPRIWLQAISRHGATHSGAPDFAYRMCLDHIPADQRNAFSLDHWRLAFNGAEPIRAKTIEEFSTAFAPSGFKKSSFYPCYGLAEATLMVSGSINTGPIVGNFSKSKLMQHQVTEVSSKEHDAISLVSSGSVLDGQKLKIVAPDTNDTCPTNVIGEICVSSPSIAGGYWNLSENSKEVFDNYIEGEGPFLRTGDLGFLLNGQLYVTGRLKDMLIIRGVNHYPQDIEQTVEKVHPALRSGGSAAFSIDVEDEEKLVIVQEVEKQRGLDFQHIIQLVRQAISQQHELQTHAVVLTRKGTIAKTSSGKIQRQATKSAFIAGHLHEVARDERVSDISKPAKQLSFILKTLLSIPEAARQAPLEIYLLEQVAHYLNVPSDSLDKDQPLSSLGLDSLNGMSLKNAIEKELQVSVSLSRLFEGSSITDLASEALRQMATPNNDDSMAEPLQCAKKEFKLSYMQQSLWLTQQLAVNSAAYNVPLAIHINSTLDRSLLRRALQDLINRHSALRTIFTSDTDEPRQVIKSEQEVAFEELEMEGSFIDKTLSEFAYRTFDLSCGPLFRAALLTDSDSKGGDILLMVAHHLVVDGRSMWLMLEEVLTFYQSHAAQSSEAALKPLSSDYAGFVKWQLSAFDGADTNDHWNYWNEQLAGIKKLEFPMANRRPPVQRFDGREVRFDVDAKFAEDLRDLAASNNTTLYVVLLSTFYVLLHRYTGESDIVVGSPVQGRSNREFESVVGCFFNMLAIRCSINEASSFRQLLVQNRRTVIDALSHQAYPSHLIAQKLETSRDLSRSPVFQVSFLLQKPTFGVANSMIHLEDTAHRQLGQFGVSLIPVERRFARNDLELEVLEAEDGLLCSLQYNSDLFDADDIQLMAEHYRELLNSVVDAPHKPISQLPMHSEAEGRKILNQWSRGTENYSNDTTVEALFSQQLATNPDNVAAVHGDASWTFAQLNDEAEKLACLIKRLNINVQK